MAEIPQDQGLRAGMDVTAVEDDEAAGDAAVVELHDPSAAAVTNFETSGESSSSQVAETVDTKVKPAVADSHTGFRGVSRTAYGKYQAQIWDSNSKAKRSLGNFGTAEEAARAYDAMAVELYGAAAVTNFQRSGESSSQAAGSDEMTAARQDSDFRGVSRTRFGRYQAQIYDSEVKSNRSLGNFGTAVEAAMAYDAAARAVRGASATTNFTPTGERSAAAGSLKKMKVKKPPTPAARTGTSEEKSEGKSSVPLGTFCGAEEAAPLAYDAAATTNYEQLPTASTTNFEQIRRAAAADDGEVSSTDLPNDFPAELPPVDFSQSLIPGPQMDDLGTDLPTAAHLQKLVHEFVKDFHNVAD